MSAQPKPVELSERWVRWACNRCGYSTVQLACILSISHRCTDLRERPLKREAK